MSNRGKRIKRMISIFVLLSLLTFQIVPMSVFAADPQPAYNKSAANSIQRPAFVEGEVIVKYKNNVSSSKVSNIKFAYQLVKQRNVPQIGAELLKIGSTSKVEDVVASLNADSSVEYAQPNYIYYPSTTDTKWNELWGLHNIGQTLATSPADSGTADYDIDAPEAWDLAANLDEIIVAVIDTGTDINHPDLAGKIWQNLSDLPDGIDNDGNGKTDDSFGWDFYNNDGTVFDSVDGDEHGTHVSGTIAAVANNSLGVTGVAPNVKIMPLKFIGPDGGTTADAIAAIEYAAAHGAKVSNNSWGGGSEGPVDDLALENAITASNMVFVAAAGNLGSNNDVTPDVPSGLNSPNIISVAAVGNDGELASFSNYGATKVDVGAPGVNILSTIPKNRYDQTAGISKGQTITFGFGMESLTSANRIDFINKAFTHLGLTNNSSTDVLLVNDGETTGSFPYTDYTSYYTSAITASSFSAVTVTTQIVNTDTDGPGATFLNNYDLVIWFAGDGDGAPGIKPLTSNDIASLSTYLGTGKKLMITGDDALLGNESDPFVTSTLGAKVYGDREEGYVTLNGIASSPYDGASYTFESAFGSSPFSDIINPINGASAVLQYVGDPDYSAAYEYLDGTSMAAPHVAGIAAVLMGQKNLTAAEAIARINATGVSLPSLAGKTSTGKMANLYNAIASQVTQPVVSLGDPVENRASQYSISFNTSSVGKLQAGDTIKVTFPNGTVLPATISADKVSLNGVQTGTSTDLIASIGQSVTFNVPNTVNPSSPATVIINASANIVNPGDGPYTLSVSTSTDPLGQASGSYNVTVPGAPVILSPTQELWTNDNTPDLIVQVEAGSAIKVLEGVTEVGSGVGAGSTPVSITLDTLAEGAHSLIVSVTDAVYNTSQATVPTINVDLTVPAPPIVNPADDNDTTLTGNAEPNAAITVTRNGATVGTVTAGSDGAFTVTIAKQPHGSTLVVTATDRAGNTSSVLNVTVVDVAPATPSGLSASAGNQSVTLSWNANTENDIAGYNVYMQGETETQFTVTGVTYTISSLTNGTPYSFNIIAIDQTGHESARSATASATPSAPFVGGGSGGFIPPLQSTDPEKVVLKSEDLKPNDAGNVQVELPSKAKEVVLPAAAVLEKTGNKLTLKNESVAIDIPRNVLEDLKELLGSDLLKEANISFGITLVTGDQASVLLSTAGKQNKVSVKSAGQIYEFNLSIVAMDGTVRTLSTFSEPIHLELKVDANTDPDVTGIFFIGSNGKLEYAGGEIVGGVIMADVHHFSKYAVLSFDKSFVDVQAGHWANKVIRSMAAKQLIAGVSDTEFAPSKSVTRAEFTAMIVRALGLKASKAAVFTDVEGTKWYASSIAAASEAGIVNGKDETRFAPDETITREQMASMIVRAYAYLTGTELSGGESDFLDTDKISKWARSSVNAAQATGLMKGKKDGMFDPQANATRAESAQVIYTLLSFKK
ncbi:S8 family serine peptidase [Cohnella sp.]|uniref:S8 family serine peptidase n=1 Tax=Cohnella sp. TaxID=1883426 RepID=UPI0035623CFC